ncbi:unnamed protein product [Prunus armeniaca]
MRLRVSHMSLAVLVCETLPTCRWQCRRMGRVCILISIITHVVGSAGGVMILSALVGLVMRFVSFTCRWQCRRVSYGVSSPGWTTHPWTRVSARKSCVLAKQSPGWIVFPGTLVWREGRLCQNFGRMSRVFSKWARHRGDVGTKTGSAPVSEEILGRVLSAWYQSIRTMSTRRPRTRGHGQRWGPNPPPPSPSPSPPAGDNASDLRHVLSQFTRTMTTALRGRRSTESSEIKRVKELGAKEFMGGPDPAEAECWITDVERSFEVLECPDGDRVRLATFLLKGNAYHWWKAAKRGYENPAAITWEEFHRVFSDQFYPPSYRYAKKSEFLYLKQGSMSVAEYEHKYNELSRFAPELVATEEDRCRRFEGGLWWDIQAVVTANTYPNMTALAQAANRVDAAEMRKDRVVRVRAHPREEDLILALLVVDGQVDGDPVLAGHTKRTCPLIYPSDTPVQGTGAQQGQGNMGQHQSQSGATSSAAGSSSSRAPSSSRGRGGRNSRGQPGRSTTQARAFYHSG